MAICICIIIVSILLIVHSIHRYVIASRREKALAEHDELNKKLFYEGIDTNSLSTARNCYTQLDASYSAVKDFANANSRKCYEDDIREVKDWAEALAQEKWDDRAEFYLENIEQLICSVLDSDSEDVEQARKDSDRILKLYDSYWDWTRKCYEENRTLWSEIDILGIAENSMDETLTSAFSDRNDFNYGHLSDRAQLEHCLSDHIASLSSKANEIADEKGEKPLD